MRIVSEANTDDLFPLGLDIAGCGLSFQSDSSKSAHSRLERGVDDCCDVVWSKISIDHPLEFVMQVELKDWFELQLAHSVGGIDGDDVCAQPIARELRAL